MADEPSTQVVASAEKAVATDSSAVTNHASLPNKVRETDAGPAQVPVDVEPYDHEDDPEDVDAELEAMRKRLKEMEDEANAVKAAGTSPSDGAVAGGARADRTGEENGGVGSAEADARSIYVGNVDYAATPEELQAHFADCGTINRVTILCNKVTGTPKGFAYIEFVDQDAVKNAVILNESPFRGRPLKVTPKRTNIPGLAIRGRGGGRGRGAYGYRGRGFGRGRPRGRWVPY